MKNFAYHRIKAITTRDLWRFFHNKMNIVETLFWPALDIVIWGTTSIWFANNNSNIPNLAIAIMTGLVFWEMTLRTMATFSVGMVNEVHEKSLLTLFTTPLTVGEWIAGTIATSSIRSLVSATFCAVIVALFYSYNIFTIGWMFIPFVLSLIVTGWAIGLFGAGLVIYYGHNVQALPWMLPWVAAPFSAVYYPLDMLPIWMKYIGLCLPTSYIFEGMRSILFANSMPWGMLATSMGLNVIYLTGAIIFFVFMFKKSKNLGLARL